MYVIEHTIILTVMSIDPFSAYPHVYYISGILSIAS